jgi:hypothetical protein
MSDNGKSDYDRKDDQLIEMLISEVKTLRMELQDHMKEEGESIKELIEAFNTAKHVVWFIKMSAAVVGGLGLAWAFLHNHFTIGVK